MGNNWARARILSRNLKLENTPKFSNRMYIVDEKGNYTLLNMLGEKIGHLRTNPKEGNRRFISWINSKDGARHVSEDLYNTAVFDVK